MFHFKAPGSGSGRGDTADAWGALTWYVEVADDQRASRQIHVYEDGRILRYDRMHWCDEFSCMVAMRFSRKAKWSVFFPGAELIETSHFEKIWRVALTSRLWQEQVKRSRMKHWGTFPAG